MEIACPLVFEVILLESRVEDDGCDPRYREIGFGVVLSSLPLCESNRVLDTEIVAKFTSFGLFLEGLEVSKDKVEDREIFL